MLPAHLSISRERLKSKENSICHSKSRSKSNEDYSKQTTNEQKRKGYGSISSISRKSREGGSRSYSKSMESHSKEKIKMSREKIKSGSGSCDLATARTLSKEKNSSGHKKSSTSEGAFENSLEMECYLEDKVRTKEMTKKSLKQTFLWFLFSIGFLCAGCFLQNRYAHLVHEDIIEFGDYFPSINHHKLAVLSDDIDTSYNIRTILMDVGSVNNYQREAAIYFVYKFRSDPSLNHSTAHPFTLQTSLLAYGFQVNGKLTDIQPLIVHDQEVTEFGPAIVGQYNYNGFQLGKSLVFPRIDNSSMFSKKININPYLDTVEYTDETLINAISNADDTAGGLIQSDDLFMGPFLNLFSYVFTCTNYTSSEADPRVNIETESLVSYDHSSLQFSSSGPKTLGAIAEVAIRVALESLRNCEPYSAEQVDNAIAEALACTLQALERHTGYFENLSFNISTILLDLRLKTDYFRNNKLNCLGKESTVKLHTNGVLTSNILFMDNRDGWPTVFHYSVSTNGSSYLESSNGTKSHKLLNVCQVVVIKDGYLWLTAAASGEFYQLEKVVASIVHKIVMDSDPLELLNSGTRQRYDVRSATVVTGKYSSKKRHVKEVLQFSEYKILKNKFQSWIETPNRNADEDQTVASGY